MNDSYKVYASKDYVDSKIIPSDWSQNDLNATDYIKNRTHWEEFIPVYTELVDNITVVTNGVNASNPFTIQPVEGATYIVTFNGIEYECVSYIMPDTNAPKNPCIGDASKMGDYSGGNNEPFLIIDFYQGQAVNLFVSGPGTYTISIKKLEEFNHIVHPLDGKYLTAHNQSASTITAGTFAGAVVAQESSQTPETSLLRNSKLVTTDTNPSYNGEICWTYE